MRTRTTENQSASSDQRIETALFAPVDIASLVVFRVSFGFLLAQSAWTHLKDGRVYTLFVEPTVHFHYFGFSWIKPLSHAGMSLLFAAIVALGIAVAVGAFYRCSAALLCLAHVYVFLLDQARYLNHEYLICLLAFLMTFIPAHRAMSLDARWRPKLQRDDIPQWALGLLRTQIGLVYFFAGVAKINPDWLSGQPLTMWLQSRSGVPVVGPWLAMPSAGLAFSYAGLVLDLFAVPLLMMGRTRAWIFATLVLFHGINAALFRIGVFPWLMIAATTLFLPPGWPRRVRLFFCAHTTPHAANNPSVIAPQTTRRQRLWMLAISAYVTLQIALPLRHFFYPGPVHWTEEGHKYAWHMKLRRKRGRIHYRVRDPGSERQWIVNPGAELHDWQLRKLATRPELILQHAHRIARRFSARGVEDVEVYAESHASLNGRRPQRLVASDVDLAKTKDSFSPAPWIVPFKPAPLP